MIWCCISYRQALKIVSQATTLSRMSKEIKVKHLQTIRAFACFITMPLMIVSHRTFVYLILCVYFEALHHRLRTIKTNVCSALFSLQFASPWVINILEFLLWIFQVAVCNYGFSMERENHRKKSIQQKHQKNLQKTFNKRKMMWWLSNRELRENFAVNCQ